jgi:solute carrier family 35 protein E1
MDYFIQIGAASFAETIKSAEPISSVLIGFLYLNEHSSLLTYSTLLPICIGVGISCIGESHFNVIGFFAAFASNICFSTRAVISKHLIKSYTTKINDVVLFHHISKYGLMILIPITILREYNNIIHTLRISTNYQLIRLCMMFIINGCAYSCYNLVSFAVLSRTELITHAVLNVFRRVVIIILTSIFFQNYLSSLNLFGVILAISGVLSFAYSKTNDNSR